MDCIVGIDLGTTNSAVAFVEAGIPGILAAADGSRLMPSIVHYAASGAVCVGEEARRSQVLHPADTIYSVKRLMGRASAELDATDRDWPFAIADHEGKAAVLAGGKRRLPEEVSSEVLKALKLRAEAALGFAVSRAVITVPAYFNNAQREATKRAGQLAGWNVERVLNEPTAAALAYGLGRLQERSRVAVFDLGGGTFDLSILELREGMFEVLATHGDTRLGGDDIDRAVGDWIAAQVRVAGGPAQLDLTMAARVRMAAEAAKVALSAATETEITLPFLTAQFSFQRVLTRAELERIARPIIERTRGHCRQALSDAGVAAHELDQVILVGGQTRMPLVRRWVGEWFGCREYEELRGNLSMNDAERKGPALNTSQHPDEAVALGAAIQGAILSGAIGQVLLLDVTPLSLGVETFGGLMNVLIPRNTTIPTKAGELFTNAVDAQREMLVHVLQGERERAKDNWSLGRFALAFDAVPRGAARVGVQFEIDADGILHVLARDTKTGHEQRVKIESAVDVDDTKVQQMVEESVTNAFADWDARRWVESALRAREAVTAARQALAEMEAELPVETRDLVAQAIALAEAVLAAERDGMGDLPLLQQKIKQLDEATAPLADALMQRAMDELLRRRGVLS
ncbi:MAG: molecular chaperone DnaK [Pedosphaera sp.]|nr:molecular chaperone DnaK [Pedosphaera sp.]